MTTPRTAFTVVVPVDGVPYAILGTGSVEVDREPTVGDVRSACQEIVSDLNAQAAAQYALRFLSPTQPETPPDKVRGALSKRARQ